MTDKIKHNGQVFTPDYLVKNILDEAGYEGEGILRRHCIDNSCGDGAFIREIIRRYVNTYKSVRGNIEGVESELETYIHGIEIEKETYERCLSNLSDLNRELSLNNPAYDILCGNALLCKKFNGKMDFVVGNPPYVRVHNLTDTFDTVKSFSFAQGGMTDMYLVFFELGLNMLKRGGHLCYITPSSWTNSVAGSRFRDYLSHHKNLVSLIDLGHYQAFKATTYTMITHLVKEIPNETFALYIYDSRTSDKLFVDRLGYPDIALNGYYYLADRHTLEELRRTIQTPCHRAVAVKNGFATLADKVFISPDFAFDEYTIPVLKASTGRWYKAFYPYDKNGKPFSRESIFANPEIASYLYSNKTVLLKRNTEEENPFWYLYGRTQALKDVYADKIAINAVIKDVKSIKLTKVPSGSGVYSGLYILTTVPYSTVAEMILSEKFINYIKSLKKYKSGGYYTFNSKDLELFLNYHLAADR